MTSIATIATLADPAAGEQPRAVSRRITGRGGVVRSAAVAMAVVALAACGSDDATSSDASAAPTEQPSASGDSGPATADDAAEMFPDVLDVELTPAGNGEFQVATTLSSPYDSPERYADAWRVLDPQGNELGVRELTHDHASEQPFTRQETIAIPDDVDEVTIEGRDQVSGYGGETVTVGVPRDGS